MTLLLIATGDRIAERASSVATGRELLALAGPPPDRVVVEDMMAEPSWDTSVSTQLAIARRVRKALAEDEFTGVVITHGLDTLEETAFLTDLMAGPARGGIVFAGALHPLTHPTPDGPKNVSTALTAAADPALKGVGAVVSHGDELHAARWATHTTGGFSSAPHPLLGRVIEGKARLTSAPPPRPPVPIGEPETDIALLKTYPDMPPSLLHTVTDLGAQGVVLEATGDGNVPVELFSTIMGLTSMNIPVVIASRTQSTEIGLAERMGAISANGLAAPKARIALMAALSKGGGVEAATRYFASL